MSAAPRFSISNYPALSEGLNHGLGNVCFDALGPGSESSTFCGQSVFARGWPQIEVCLATGYFITGFSYDRIETYIVLFGADGRSISFESELIIMVMFANSVQLIVSGPILGDFYKSD